MPTLADRGAALGGRPRLQPRLPRAPAARARTGHAAPGDRPRRGRAAVTAGHLPAAVDAPRSSKAWRTVEPRRMVHLSHAVTDGVGGVEMFANIYDLERDPPPQKVPPLPIPQDLSPNDLMRQGFNRLPGAIAGGVRGALVRCRARRRTSRSRPGSPRVGGVVDYAMSGARVIGPVADPSPLLRRRSLSSRSEAIDIVFGDLHRAAKAAGGSINDAYLAGVCGALAALSRGARACRSRRLPMAVPVNLRSDADPAGGNRFAGVNLAAPIGIADPAARIKNIRGADDPQARRARDRHGRRDRAGDRACCPDTVLEVHGRVDRQLRRAGQQCAGVRRRHLHRRRKDVAAVRNRPAARRRDDGRAGLPIRLLHDHRPLRPGGRSPMRSCSPSACCAGFDEVLALGAASGRATSTPTSFTDPSRPHSPNGSAPR